MNPLGLGFLSLTITLVIVVAASLRVLARRAGVDEPLARRISRATFAALSLWLGATLLLAQRGFFRAFESVPPRIPLSALTVMLTVIALSRTSTFVRLLDAMPPSWPIALQVFRVPVELLLWALYHRNAIPIQMTFEGRNFDVLAGVSAPLVAYAVQRGKLAPLGIRLWNVASLALLANIVGVTISSLPGPLHFAWGGTMPVVVADPPFIWLPAFLVPLAAIGHMISLRKTGRSVREVAPLAQE